MSRTKTVAGIWLVTATLAGLMIAVLAGPMMGAWRCHDVHATGEQAEAEVVGLEPEIGVAVRLTGGSRAGEACLLKASEVRMEAFSIGDRVQVVLPAARPGDCTLLATVEASGSLLTGLSAVSVALLLGLALAALVLQRLVTKPPTLTTHMDLAGGGPACPRCAKPMSEGYVPLLAGLHWREPGEPTGLPHALHGLPGTVGWRGRPRVHAYRCEPCEILTLRYGKPDGRS